MQQLFRLLIFLIQPYMFRATNCPMHSENLYKLEVKHLNFVNCVLNTCNLKKKYET